MTHRFFDKAILAAFVFVAVSCGGSKENTSSSTDVAPVVALKNTTVEAASGSQFVEVTCSGSWTLSCSADWVTLGMKAGTGSTGVPVSYDANPSAQQRTASIILTSGGKNALTTLVQKGNTSVVEPYITLSQAVWNVSAAGGQIDIEVHTNVAFTTTIAADATGWISGTDSQSVFSVAPNTGAARSGVITFKANDNSVSATATISQNAASAQPSATVTTDSADGISVTGADITASFASASSIPVKAGFEWGTTSASLSNTVYSTDEVTAVSGIFSYTLTGLSANTTYYYRAFVFIQEGEQSSYFYGQIRSFTTHSSSEPPSASNQAGWFELPLMNIEKSGGYMYNSTNTDDYYAYHFCPDLYSGGKKARNYTVCFSAKHHCPVWVAAPRHTMYVGSANRTDAYKKDPDIPADIQYTSTSAGSQSGCNRGHMLGSAERTATTEVNRQVFYMSNIAPQLSSGFNTGGGGWNLLEDWVDTKVCSDTLYVVIGCYFDKFTDGYGYTVNPKKITYAGRTDVSFPTMFYYILMRTKSGNSGKSLKNCSASEIQCAAFVRSHTGSLKGQKPSSKEMMSVSALEEITGYTYFPNVPNAPKTTFKASDWGL